MTPVHAHKRHLIGALVAMVAGAATMACTLVGSGDLHVQNDLSGLGADNTRLQAFAPDAGDAWPPNGFVNLWITGDDFGSPPSYGMDGFLYLVRTDDACPMSEAAPEVFDLADVTIVGIVTVRDGSVNQFITMEDTAQARQDRFALIEIGTITAAGVTGHLIHRCGTVTWN